MGEKSLYRIIISSRARQMLKLHVSFLARTNPEAAHRFRIHMMDSIRSLSVMPDRFLLFDISDIQQKKYRKMLVQPNYLVLYQIREQTVFVDLIIDGRQDFHFLQK